MHVNADHAHQVVQLLKRDNQRLRRWWVHEVKPEQIVDAHGFERQHRHAQVAALDLRHPEYNAV